MQWSAMLVRLLFGAELVALAAAVLVTVARRARSRGPSVGGLLRVWTVVAVLAATTIVAISVLAGVARGLSWPVLVEHQATVPLVGGLVAVVLCALPPLRRSRRGAADLAPRTLVTFAHRWWYVAVAVVTVVVLLVSVAAGMLSQPDDEGSYRVYEVDFGAMSASTGIHGWYYSVPALAILTGLVVGALVVVAMIARPPLADGAGRQADVTVRRWRSQAVLALTCGAIVLHLAQVLRSLAGTASLTARMSTGDGTFGAGATFAALEGPLRAASYVLEAGGWFLWFTVLAAAAVPALRPSRTASWRSASR